MKKILFTAICMLLVVFGCGSDTQPDPIEPVDPVDPEPEGEVMYMGILPLRLPTDMLERFEPTEQYLREKTGLNIKLKLYPTEGATGGYTAVVRDLVEGNIHFAFLAPVTFVQAHEVSSGAVVSLVCASNKGSPTYTGDIVVKVDSDYQTIEDLEGKPVAGTSASSTSGNLMPTAYLLSLGIEKEEYFQFEFLGAHDKAVEAVLLGTMEAALINEATLAKYNADSVQLRSIYTHPSVPEFPFCVNTDKVSAEDLQKVKDAFLSQHETEEGLAGIKASNPKYDKWVSIEWEDYLGIKEAIDQVHGDIFYDLDQWQG